MKIYLAYALVIIGIPIFIGYLLGAILNIPVSLVIGLSRGNKETPLEVGKAGIEAYKWSSSGKVEMDLRDRIAHTCLDILSGLGTVFTAGLIFYFLGISPGIIVLLIIVVWEIIIAISQKESFRMLFGHILGIAIGSFIVMWLFAF
jgi:hypothetical protein